MTPDPVTYRGKTYKVKMYLYQLYDGSGAVVRIFDEEVPDLEKLSTRQTFCMTSAHHRPYLLKYTVIGPRFKIARKRRWTTSARSCNCAAYTIPIVCVAKTFSLNIASRIA